MQPYLKSDDSYLDVMCGYSQSADPWQDLVITSRVLIEAMLCKIPVVAVNVPGIKVVIQNMKTGYLISKSDPNELANAIQFVLEHSDFSSTIAENAYELAASNFSKEGL